MPKEVERGIGEKEVIGSQRSKENQAIQRE